MRGVRKVLVAVNGRLDIINHGIRLARDEKTWVTVLKVIPEYDGDLSLTGIKDIEDVLSSGREGALAGMRELAGREGALIKARVEEGEIDEKIVEVAREERADIIIMGAQKKSFFRSLFGTNVVEKVIGAAPCPVLVVDAQAGV